MNTNPRPFCWRHWSVWGCFQLRLCRCMQQFYLTAAAPCLCNPSTLPATISSPHVKSGAVHQTRRSVRALETRKHNINKARPETYRERSPQGRPACRLQLGLRDRNPLEPEEQHFDSAPLCTKSSLLWTQHTGLRHPLILYKAASRAWSAFSSRSVSE